MDKNEELASQIEADDSAIEDVPGSPTWPILPPESPTGASAPPVGLSWQVVADRLGLDRAVLEHDGTLIFPGEYFPEAGFVINPDTLEARHVDVGDIALRPGYFLGDSVVGEQLLRLPRAGEPEVAVHPIIPYAQGPVVALFLDAAQAEHARRRLLRGSLAAGVSTRRANDAIEVRVDRAQLVGRVATLLASHGGAIVTVGGESLVANFSGGPMATASTAFGYSGDARRPGTGVDSDSEGPEFTNRATLIGQR